jgi:hypothetical protein
MCHKYVTANTYLDRTRESTQEAENEPEVPAYDYPAPADD